jgi:transcriptional regulator with XRE-family HTH domain
MLHLGKTARHLREKKGLTVRGAAVKLGISHAHLSKIENNLVAPSFQLIEKFKIVFGVDLPVLAWCLYGDPMLLPPAIRGPMLALAEAWRSELGDLAEEKRNGKAG